MNKKPKVWTYVIWFFKTILNMTHHFFFLEGIQYHIFPGQLLPPDSCMTPFCIHIGLCLNVTFKECLHSLLSKITFSSPSVSVSLTFASEYLLKPDYIYLFIICFSSLKGKCHETRDLVCFVYCWCQAPRSMPDSLRFSIGSWMNKWMNEWSQSDSLIAILGACLQTSSNFSQQLNIKA